MASKNITFETIPASTRKPGKYFEFNTKLAVRTLPTNKQRLEIIGQRLAAGSAPVGLPFKVYDSETAAAMFGRGSQLHLMIIAAITANRYVDITAIGVDDNAAGAAATHTHTFTGTTTAAGLVTVSCGNRAIEVAVDTGKTAAQVAAQVEAELDKQTNWPVTYGSAAGVITGTNRHKGTVGNTIKMDASTTAPGLAVATAQPSGGLVDPDLTNTLAAAFTASEEILVVPYGTQTALTALRTHLNDRSSAIEQRGAVGVYASTGTLSAATTLAGQLNAGRLVGALLPGSASPGYEIAAAFASVMAFEEDPAMPLNTLVLTGIAAPNLASRLSRTEQETCLANGVTPLEVGPGNQVQIVRAVTTYTVNAEGTNDISLLDVTTIRTLDFVRKSVRERLSLRFPRGKKTVRNKAKVRSEVLDVLIKLEELEVIEAVEENKAGLLVEDDLQDPNRLDIRIPCDVVNGLHVIAARIDLLL
jgi:phage tail sheath gpL-like